MVQQHQRDSTSPPPILDIPQGANHQRWPHSKRNSNWYTAQETEAILKQIHDSPPRAHKMQTACKKNGVLARTE